MAEKTLTQKIKDLNFFDLINKLKNILNELKGNVFIDAPQDGNSYGRKDGDWSQIQSGGGIPDAPENGLQYARQDGNWTPIQGSLQSKEQTFAFYMSEEAGFPLSMEVIYSDYGTEDATPSISVVDDGVYMITIAQDSTASLKYVIQVTPITNREENYQIEVVQLETYRVFIYVYSNGELISNSLIKFPVIVKAFNFSE